jgi:NAD(P)-dependent dehydrogenase (short-subunit alcohol dehydrogenase family)
MQRSITGEVAWITGAGSGIGQSAAVKLAAAGAKVVLTGRRSGPLEETAALVRAAGGEALVAPADCTDPVAVEAVVKEIMDAFGRCDIVVNNAGMNIVKRSWSDVTDEGFDSVIAADLNGPFYVSRAVLPIMRAQKGGLLIQVSSWAGVYVPLLTGPAYTAAKHGLVAMSESINQAECMNGIRSCCICPGEVATPILDNRPVPVPDEEKARMLQSDDLGETILYVARMPATVCVNEILISPTWNRLYVANLQRAL